MNLYKSGETPEIGDRVKFFPNKKTDEWGIKWSIIKGSLGIVVDIVNKWLVEVNWDDYYNDNCLDNIKYLRLIRRTNLKAFL